MHGGEYSYGSHLAGDGSHLSFERRQRRICSLVAQVGCLLSKTIRALCRPLAGIKPGPLESQLHRLPEPPLRASGKARQVLAGR